MEDLLQLISKLFQRSTLHDEREKENVVVIQFSDAPYRFFEAKPSPFLIRCGRTLNRAFYLPGPNHRIREMRVDGATEEVREAKKKGERLMFGSITRPTAIRRW